MALRGEGSKHTRIYGWRSLKQPNLTIDSHKVILRVILCEIKFHIKRQYNRGKGLVIWNNNYKDENTRTLNSALCLY